MCVCVCVWGGGWGGWGRGGMAPLTPLLSPAMVVHFLFFLMFLMLYLYEAAWTTIIIPRKQMLLSSKNIWRGNS